MAADHTSREYRLRKQAERQSLYTQLANLREREASYIEATSPIPELVAKQITESRQLIVKIEDELHLNNDNSDEAATLQLYKRAFEAELARDFAEAISIYRDAARNSHPDADAAVRSIRHSLKQERTKITAAAPWVQQSSGSGGKIGLILAGIFLLIIVIILGANLLESFTPPQEEPAFVFATVTPGSEIAEAAVVPDTPTLPPTATPGQLADSVAVPSTPTFTPELATPTAETVAQPLSPDSELPTAILTATPAVAQPLRVAPVIIGPVDNLVWQGGAVIFEFEDLDLPENELYCLNTLRGYDNNNAENWSFPPSGNRSPSIPVEANVFEVAQAQEMRCITWSASIGRDSCSNIISHSTAERVIGLPDPCD